MQQKEKNDELNSTQRKTNGKNHVFPSLESYVKNLCLICWTISHTRATHGAVGAAAADARDANKKTKKNVRKCILSVWISVLCYSDNFVLFSFHYFECYVVINRKQTSASEHSNVLVRQRLM